MPIVKFKKMSKEDNIDIVRWAFFENDETLPVYKDTINYFNELAMIDKNKLSKEEIDNIINSVVSNYYDNNEYVIDDYVSKYNLIWKEYNDKYIETLCKYFKIEWNSKIDEIICDVGFIPISPRYLDECSFSTTVNIEDYNVVEITAHEVLHFVWFMKWKELYPLCSREEYECPYIPWKYSEMVVDFILNEDDICNVFNRSFGRCSYESFYKQEYNGENVMEHLRSIYSKEIDIDVKIKEGYKYVLEVYSEGEKEDEVS